MGLASDAPASLLGPLRPPVATPRASTAQPTIPCGSRIFLCGLSRADLNGRTATVKDFDSVTSRYAVEVDGRLDTTQKILIKPENLVQSIF